MLTVLENAYLRKAQQHKNYSATHEKILCLLMHEKKYYAKDELYCTTNYNHSALEKAIKELEQLGLITTEGWLVKLAEITEEIAEETIITKRKK